MNVKDQYQWILDSESSQYVTKNLHLLYDSINIEETMEMSNEVVKNFEIKVKVKLQVNKKTIILNDIYYLNSSKNIIVLTKFMSKVFKITVKGDKIIIKKNNQSIISMSKIKTNN